MISSLTTRLPRRFRAQDDTGSMAMFLVIAVVGLAIAALLVPMVVTSSRITRSDTSRVHALDAAQAGLNVMVGQIRAAHDLDGVGKSTDLPCGPLSGVVNGVGAASYTVSVVYYLADPVAVTDPGKMECTSAGPFDQATDGNTPKFARIISTGTDGSPSNGSTAGRKLATTYVFRTTDTNIDGGRIRIYPPSSTAAELCLDAGSTTPLAATIIKLQPCATPPKDQQVFAYRPDLTIQLLSSVTATYPNGLCLAFSPPATAGRAVSLGVCAPLGLPPYRPPYSQQWSFNDNGGYTASLDTSAVDGVLSSQCFSAASQAAGVQLMLASCGEGGTSSTTQAWIPSAAVGAGAADAPQLVNFSEFGRCLDVTGQNTGADHLIDFPCKQNPFPGAVAWNQKFTTPGIAAGATSALGQIYTTKDGTKYCLTSPGTNEGYVTVSTCSATNARQTWTVYNGNSPLAYSAKYTIVDNASRCLGLTAPKGTEQWSAIDVETCTGARQQKWNATADLATSVMQDVNETP